MEVLGIRLLQMEQLLRVSRSSIYKAPGSQRIQLELRTFIKVFAAARANFDDAAQMSFWFMSFPLERFYYSTPFELFAKGAAYELIGHLEQERSNAAWPSPMARTDKRDVGLARPGKFSQA
ncbi:MAG: hypothetical protein ACREP7_23490 [Lysobacter sp.]